MEPLQIRVPQKLKEKLDKEVDTGLYPNRSEAIRTAIRNLVTGDKK